MSNAEAQIGARAKDDTQWIGSRLIAAGRKVQEAFPVADQTHDACLRDRQPRSARRRARRVPARAVARPDLGEGLVPSRPIGLTAEQPDPHQAGPRRPDAARARRCATRHAADGRRAATGVLAFVDRDDCDMASGASRRGPAASSSCITTSASARLDRDDARFTGTIHSRLRYAHSAMRAMLADARRAACKTGRWTPTHAGAVGVLDLLGEGPGPAGPGPRRPRRGRHHAQRRPSCSAPGGDDDARRSDSPSPPRCSSAWRRCWRDLASAASAPHRFPRPSTPTAGPMPPPVQPALTEDRRNPAHAAHAAAPGVHGEPGRLGHEPGRPSGHRGAPAGLAVEDKLLPLRGASAGRGPRRRGGCVPHLEALGSAARCEAPGSAAPSAADAVIIGGRGHQAGLQPGLEATSRDQLHALVVVTFAEAGAG